MKRKYTKEFKLQSIELASSLDNLSVAAKQLGILDSCIHNWKRTQSLQLNSDVKPKISSAESEELKRLRRETAEQKKVIHILKAAAAFFSQDHLE